MHSSSRARTSQKRSQLPAAPAPYQTKRVETISLGAGGSSIPRCCSILSCFFFSSFFQKKKKKGEQLFQADSSRISLDVRQCSDACAFPIWRPSFRQKEVRQWS